jgi:hypothetical protein
MQIGIRHEDCVHIGAVGLIVRHFKCKHKTKKVVTGRDINSQEAGLPRKDNYQTCDDYSLITSPQLYIPILSYKHGNKI